MENQQQQRHVRRSRSAYIKQRVLKIAAEMNRQRLSCALHHAAKESLNSIVADDSIHGAVVGQLVKLNIKHPTDAEFTTMFRAIAHFKCERLVSVRYVIELKECIVGINSRQRGTYANQLASMGFSV